MAVGASNDADSSNLDVDGGEQDGERGPQGDPPPAWDGEDVAKRWKKFKRELLLWQGDTRLPKKRQGLKVWRRLTGKAADIAEHIPDAIIQSVDGVQKIIEHFERRYADTIAAVTDTELDDIIYQGARTSARTFAEYVQDVQTAWDKYEAAITPETLPERLKARMLLRHAKLTDQQASKVTTWLDGDRTLTAIKECLAKLDSGKEVTDALTGKTSNKNFCDDYDDEYWEDYFTMWSGWHQEQDFADIWPGWTSNSGEAEDQDPWSDWDAEGPSELATYYIDDT